MASREQLISEIKKLQEKIESDKERGKKMFNLAKEKLEESRQQTEEIRNRALDEVLVGMEGELPEEVRKLAKEAKETDEELNSLEKSVQKNMKNDSLIEKAQADLKEQLKELLHAETREEIIHEVQELSKIPENIRTLKAKLFEMDDNESENASAVKQETETEIEKEIKEMNQRIEAIVSDAKTRDNKNYYIIATIHNTLWRLVADSNNEEFYLSHGRSAVWQARGENTVATFNEKRENNNDLDPRDFN